MGKRNKERLIPLTKELIEKIDKYLKMRETIKIFDVKYLLYMGKYKNEAKSVFGDGCRTFDDIMRLTDYARSVSDESTVVLIKASRFMNFDIIAKGVK